LVLWHQLAAHGTNGAATFDYVDRVVGSQAATLAVNDVFFAISCIFIFLLPLVWFTRPPFAARGADASH
jgi:DHA2 family multidrug resistance protein